MADFDATNRRDQRLAAGWVAEGALMERIRARDVSAFETLYRDYHPRLSRFLLQVIRRPAIVEEVLDDTMMVVWLRPESFEGKSRLSTWIFAIAYRKAMKAVQRWDQPPCDPEFDGPSDDPAPDEGFAQRRLHEILARAMDALSPTHRAVVDLTYFHELGYREIAEIMVCPVETVKTRMLYARRHLRRLVTGRLVDLI